MEPEALMECLSWEEGECDSPEDIPAGHRLDVLAVGPSTLRTSDFQILSEVKDLVSIKLSHGPYPDVACSFIEWLDLSSIHTLIFDNVPLKNPFLIELENRRQKGTLGELTVLRSRLDWFSADIVGQTIARWTSLKELSLKGHQLTPDAVRALKPLKQLNTLEVALAQHDERLLQEMSQVLPDCKVYIHPLNL